MTMLISALIILPVVFVTVTPTTFEIDEKLLISLENNTYIANEVVDIDGKKKSKKTEQKIPSEIILSLETLKGNKYTTAKELSDDVEKIIGKEQLLKFESLIHTNSRSNNLYWLAVLLIAIAAAGHASWMANLYAVATDVFPRKGVASVAGIGGMVGALAGVLADFGLGRVLTSSGPSGYFFAFLIAGLIYLVLLGIIHLLIPKLQALDENLEPIQE